jgi:hypothetical protein
MIDSTYSLYLNSVYDLTRSFILKSEATARSMNDTVSSLGSETVSDSPYTWKYYLNLNGQPHATDLPMTVTSIDTLETIEFTKETLAVHKATRGAYVYGSSYYNELVSRYPRQELLIRGILKPVPMETAIEADDYSILSFDQSKVEVQETNLIIKLNEWIQAHRLRWDNDGYGEIDDLYNASYIAVLVSSLVPTILSIRLDNCFTNCAHSYHIWSYLGSKAGLDKYRRSLTIGQSLFLYRNIRWIMANAGKQKTLDLLIDKMLTERSIPVYGFDIKHNTEELLGNLTPKVEVVRYPINEGIVSSAARDYLSCLETETKIAHLAEDNYKDLGSRAESLDNKFSFAGKNRVDTKVLESVVVSTSNVNDIDINDVLAVNWVELAVRKIYTANLLIVNPHTGETIQIDPLEAYILYLYVYNLSIGSELSVIPSVGLNWVMKDPIPTVDELKGLVESRFWIDEMDELLFKLPSEDRLINNVDFYNYCEKQYDVRVGLSNLFKHHSRSHGRIQYELLSNALMSRKEYALSNTNTYMEWFELMEIDIAEITKEDATTFANNIISAVTGVDSSEVLTPKIIQSDLVDIVDKLTSYNIHFVKTAIETESKLVNNNKRTLDHPKASGANDNFVVIPQEYLVLGYTHVPKLEELPELNVVTNDLSVCTNVTQLGNSVYVTDHETRISESVDIPLANLTLTELTG